MTYLLTSGANGRYFEHSGLIQMFVYVFAIRKNQVISSKTLVWSRD